MFISKGFWAVVDMKVFVTAGGRRSATEGIDVIDGICFVVGTISTGKAVVVPWSQLPSSLGSVLSDNGRAEEYEASVRYAYGDWDY